MAGENYKRIARNTVMLYLRFLVSLFISLFTSRVVLQTLGFNDFGLYNVVGGFVAMLAFINGYISEGTARFLTFQIGQSDLQKSRSVFSAALALHVGLALLVLVAGETVGLWYIENKLNIQPSREEAAMFVFQLSLATTAVSVIQTPFSAAITAHEDMNIYAYFNIFDVVMKLLIVYLLLVVHTDKLMMYAFFYFCVSLLTSSFYLAFCLRKYEECRLKLRADKHLYLEMFNYIGWNAVGAVAFTLNGQGLTVLLNSFFGTVVNAARGVAGSVSNIISQFVFNFQTAMRPQIIKNYASGNIAEMKKLVIYCARYSSYLCMFFGIPIFVESDSILRIWLGNVPPYADTFVRLTIIQIMFQAVDYPIGYGINAVGKMKLPNVTSSLIYLLVLPISYMAMRLGANPTIAYLVSICCFPGVLICDLWILNKYIGFERRNFLFSVVLQSSLFIIIGSVIPSIVHHFMNLGFLRLCIVTFLSWLVLVPLIYYRGLNDTVRKYVRNKIRSHIFLKRK